MSRIASAAGVLISGYFIFMIVKHMILPGANIGYTRMLMFACLGTIPVSFMTIIVGGPDRWPSLVKMTREAAGGPGPLSLLALAGIITVAVILPLVLLAGASFMMGLRLGSIFLLFYIPVMIRLVTASSQECIKNGFLQIGLLFASMVIAVGIVAILEKHSSAEVYAKQVQAVWNGYDYASSARMFFWVTVFALVSQIIELCYAVAGVLGRR